MVKFLVNLFALFCLGCGGGQAAPATNSTRVSSELVIAIVQHINAQRVSANLTPLRSDARLNAAAQWFADDMLAHGREFRGTDSAQHIGSDGSQPGDRIRRAGFPLVLLDGNRFDGWEEGAPPWPDGVDLADWCFRNWMNASRAPLDGHLTDIGVGVAGKVVVADFAVRNIQ